MISPSFRRWVILLLTGQGIEFDEGLWKVTRVRAVWEIRLNPADPVVNELDSIGGDPVEKVGLRNVACAAEE
jgi:hypothetical protein